MATTVWSGIRVLATAGIVALAASACSARETPPPPAVGHDNLTVRTPEATGALPTVTWGLSKGEPYTLDPAFAGDYSPNTVIANMCEGLLRVTPEFSVEPNLAEKVDQVDDTTVVFTLRQGVTFWNGDPLTADDVVFSLKRNTEAQGSYGPVFEKVKSITATSPTQVTVKLTQPNAAFLPQLATLAGAVQQKSAVDAGGPEYGTATKGVVCTGPYEFDSWKSGEEITLKANTKYWNADLKPRVDSIVFKFFNDDTTLTNALTSGGIDGAYEVPYTSINAFQQSNGTLYYGKSTKYMALRPMSAKGASSNEDIRAALNYAIDKKAYVTGTLQGAGEPLASFTTPFTWASDAAKGVYDEGYKQISETGNTQDPQKAKDLIAKSGYDTSKPVVMVVLSGDTSALNLATAYQGSVKDLGLKVDIKQIPANQIGELFTNEAKRNEVDFLLASAFWEAPTPLQYLCTSLCADSFYNFIGYSNPEVTKYVDLAVGTMDGQKSAEYFVQGQAIWAPAYTVIPIAQEDELLYMKKGVTGAPSSIAYLSMPWAAMLGASGG